MVVVLLHGGFWKTAYDRTHTRPMARALAGRDCLVATPEYRRVGPGGHGGWPATGADVEQAVSALPELLAGIGLDPAATAGPLRVTGHSAGGHLALWLASRARDAGLPVERTVPLAPVCDLREAIDRGLGSDAARAFLGRVDPDEADPMVLLDAAPGGGGARGARTRRRRGARSTSPADWSPGTRGSGSRRCPAGTSS